MAKIRHIAMTTANPSAVAEFYKEAFDMEEVRRSPQGAVFLSDGYINLAILNHKTEEDADVGPNGPNFNGIHHFGFLVEDLDAASKKLEKAKRKHLSERSGLRIEMTPMGGRNNFEMKWEGPDGVVIDISHIGWQGTT